MAPRLERRKRRRPAAPAPVITTRGWAVSGTACRNANVGERCGRRGGAAQFGDPAPYRRHGHLRGFRSGRSPGIVWRADSLRQPSAARRTGSPASRDRSGCRGAGRLCLCCLPPADHRPELPGRRGGEPRVEREQQGSFGRVHRARWRSSYRVWNRSGEIGCQHALAAVDPRCLNCRERRSPSSITHCSSPERAKTADTLMVSWLRDLA